MLSPKRAAHHARARLLRRWPNLSYVALPLFIIFITFAGSAIVYSVSAANLEVARTRAIERQLRDNQAKMQASFDSYSQLLMSGVGRVNSGPVDAATWQEFMAVYDLRVNFPGMEAVGLIQKPQGVSESKLTYVSPDTEATRSYVGYDLATVPQMQQALLQSSRDNTTAISETLPTVRSTKTGFSQPAPGFIMVRPFYDQALALDTPAERQAALRGYTGATFRGDIFFSQLFKENDLSHTKLTVYIGDIAPENRLYEMGTNTDSDVRHIQQVLLLYGQGFTMVYAFDTASILSFSQTFLPQALLFGGMTLGLLFAGVTGFMLRARYRRLTFEKERDVEFAKDELLSLASHQLRTPATGVKQYLGMVLQGFAGDISDKQREYLARAYASNDRQLHIINDILHLAKIDAGRITLAKREFDMAQMIREVIDEQHSEASKSNIELIQQLPPKALIVGDSHMLRMVVENLVSNAVKYTPTDGKVEVYLARRGNRWVVTVKDSGVGIAKADFPKLFQQFSRISNARSEHVTGTGVGLYLAHHLTILHGGTISVSSSVGKGSTFTVRLPRKL